MSLICCKTVKLSFHICISNIIINTVSRGQRQEVKPCFNSVFMAKKLYYFSKQRQ